MIAVESTDIFLGRIVKAFGIRGELKFVPSPDFWVDVLQSGSLTVRSQGDDEVKVGPVELERVRPHSGTSYVMKVKGVDDRDQAEAAVGSEFFISLEALDVELPPDRLLPFQVIGRTAKTEDGSVVGRVTAVHFSPAHDVYEVTGEDGQHLVPAVPEIVVAVERDGEEIVIRPIPGLLDS